MRRFSLWFRQPDDDARAGVVELKMPDPIVSVPAQTTPTPAAPAPPSTAPIAPALKTGDFSAYQSAKRDAHAIGYVPEDAPAVVEPPAPKAPAVDVKAQDDARAVSKRQQQINDYERRIAEQTQRIARLESESATRVKAPAAPAPTVTTSPDDPRPDPTDTTKYPDGQFDLTFQEELGRWAGRQEFAKARTAAEQTHREASERHAYDQRVQRFETQAATFKERVQAVNPHLLGGDQAQVASAAKAAGINPDLLTLKPSIMLQPGERPTFGHAVADVLLESDQPEALLRHLSDPAEATRLSELEPTAFYREIGRIEARLAKPAIAGPTPPKTITEAPAPPPTVATGSGNTTDPVEAALKAGDFTRYQQAKRRKELTALGL